MVKLEYYNGKNWQEVNVYPNETIAWITLGGDDYNYRTIDEQGKILTDKSDSKI